MSQKKMMPIEKCSDCIYQRLSSSLIRKDYCIYNKSKEREITKYVYSFYIPEWCPLPDAKI